MAKELKFPKGFLWGTATSSYQIEGGNINDWSEWEQSEFRILNFEFRNKDMKNFISGKASNSWEMFDADLGCIKELHNNAYRFSIEWSRVEREEGVFDEAVINKYKDQVKKLKENNIEPFVTLYHWPVPLWFRDKGSWLRKKNINYFVRYVERMVGALGSVRFWVTINEPLVYASHSYLKGDWPPNQRSLLKYKKVIENLVYAHQAAYKAIKKINKETEVGVAKNNSYFDIVHNRLLDKLMERSANWFWNESFLDNISDSQDFIGLNYYFHNRIKGLRFNQNENKQTNDLGWEIYPEGIYHTLKQLVKYNKPIYITENGLADESDTKRADFIRNHLANVHKAIQEGADVRGYFHWSLLDNFEWALGFVPKFGLYKINKENGYNRIARSSVDYYKKVCQDNAIKI